MYDLACLWRHPNARSTRLNDSKVSAYVFQSSGDNVSSISVRIDFALIDLEELEVLQKQRNSLEDRLQRLEWMLSGNRTSNNNSDEDEREIEELVRNLRHQNHMAQSRHKKLLKKYHESFHPIWGQLFKTGYKNSRYAHQTERFACIYTSHVSNLMFYSPMKNFKARMDSMVHDSSSKSEL